MRAYLYWDLSSVPLNSTVNLMQVVLTVSNPEQGHTKQHADQQDPNMHPPATSGQALAVIDVCLVTSPWADGGEGVPPDALKVFPDGTSSNVHQEPGFDSSKCYQGSRALDGETWTFPLTKIAQLWVSGKEDNNGVVLRPHEPIDPPSATWTVEFHGYAYTTTSVPPKPPTVAVGPNDAAQTTLAFTPPPEEASATPPPSPNQNVFGNSGGPSFGNTSSPTGLEVAPPPAPQASPAVAPGVALPVSRRIKTPGYVWLGVAAGLAGIALLWRALAPEDVVVSENRIASLLRLRQQAKASV